MGFFSSNCKGCGHPLLGLGATESINVWMNNGVAIAPDGSILKGGYDGYGRLDGSDFGDQPAVGDNTTVWHQACWRVAGSPTDYRGPSEHAADQGWFFEDGAHDMAEPTMPGEDPRSG